MVEDVRDGEVDEEAPDPPEPPLLLLDACCAINLLASGVAAQILEALPYEVAAADFVVEQEVLDLRPAAEAEDDEVGIAGEDEEVTLEPLVDAALLRLVALQGEEEEATFVALALQLDDGEAMTGALAIHRGAMVATDDRKAIRLLSNEVEPGVEILRTSELLKAWADGADVPGERLHEALERIETLASFVPPRDDPLRQWWREARRQT